MHKIHIVMKTDSIDIPLKGYKRIRFISILLNIKGGRKE